MVLPLVLELFVYVISYVKAKPI